MRRSIHLFLLYDEQLLRLNYQDEENIPVFGKDKE